MKIVIYKEFGLLQTTTEENYNARIRNASMIQKWYDFTSAQDIIEYCIKYLKKTKEDFIDKTNQERA